MPLEKIGYKLSAEEFGAADLVSQAERAEDAGFGFAAISDHFHPWTDEQGQSPFVWSVLGAIATATDRLELHTGVTCPTIRMHPALVAQAAATTATLLPGRFSLGLGTGEALNEHILGDRWPPASVRRQMLDEAIDVIRELWSGGMQTHHGRYFTVENACIYSLPDQPPPLLIAAGGKKATKLAAEKGDGIIALAPDEKMLEGFDSAGGAGKPRYAEVTVCWGDDRDEALKNAARWWPIVGLGGELSQELPLPRHFEAAADNVEPEDLEGKIAAGPDPEEHLDLIHKFADAGYTHIWVHQIGPHQDGFFDFYESQILPKL
ncbi:MAG: TIGR03557 family F420-dependent LLM class oxidoreductase [Actinomycetota bacterium]